MPQFGIGFFMLMITFDTVSYFYPESKVPAIHNLSLSIQPGERIAVMGSNGSGKTTFAHLIAGLLTSSRGIIKKEFSNDGSLPVGMIFQNPDNQLVAMTVEKELAFTLENLGQPIDKISEQIQTIARRFHLEHLLKKLTNELSGGEKQKIALASVMISEPELLLLDEPDSFLDQKGKKELFEELEIISSSRPNTTIIHITQFPEAARQYDRLLVFSNATISADNTPKAVFDDTDFCIHNGLKYAKKSAPSIPVTSLKAIPHINSLDRINCRKLAFGYEHTLFDNLTVTFSRSEIVGVTGLSGSGKTTLGLLLNRLLQPSSGDIQYLNQSGDLLPDENLPGQISMVFQQAERQFFLPAVKEELTFGPSNFNQYPDNNQLHQLCSLIGLPFTAFSTRDPLTLSGGEQRRLAVGSILSFLPNFIVFDEPTCGLDITGYEQFKELILQLKDLGIGIIIISHDFALISAVSDRVLTLSNQTGTILTRREFAEAHAQSIF